MMGNEGISVADALALRGNNGGGGGFGNGFGGDGWWIIVLILLFGAGGWGRGGFGGGGGYDACCTPATAQGVADAFNFNQLDNGLRGLEQGLCNGFYTSAQQINSVLAALQNCCCDTKVGMLTGFNGVNQGICTLGYNVQAGFNTLGNQLASCCCDLERGQEAIKYEIANVANTLMVAGDKNTDRIINYLTQTEMDKLRTELQSAQFQLSQLSQTDNIINRLMPVAKPAYLTCSPYASAFGLGNYNVGYNNGGCGCC
jgi:hypothetical protein